MESKIMIVDDNPVNRKLLTTILSREGYHSVEAENGEDALRLIQSEKPDVILLDIMMPGKDGFSVCQELRQNPDFEDTPVLFLSALGEVKDRVKGFDSGGSDYITKPYHQAEVLARVKHSLSLSRKTQRQKLRQLSVEISERAFRQNQEQASAQQRSLLPGRNAGSDVFESAWWQKNPGGTSGELFNLGRLDSRHCCAYIFDAGGQGLAAAATALALNKLISVRPGGILKPSLPQGPGWRVAGPAEVLGALERTVGLEGVDTFFSMQYLLLDTKTAILSYANVGGKPFPLLMRADGRPAWLSGTRPSKFSKAEDFYQGEVKLKKGDRIYLMSDGVTRAGAGEGKSFGEARVEALLNATRDRRLADCVKALEGAVEGFSDADGESRSVLGLEFKGGLGLI